MCAISHPLLQIVTANFKLNFKFHSNFGIIDTNSLKI